MVVGDWLTFAEIEKATGTPANTLRRWVDSFPEYLPHRTEGRVRHFHRDVLPVVQKIAVLFGEGKRTQEVTTILATDGTPITVEMSAPAVRDVSMPLLVQAEVGRALGESLGVIADQRRRLDAQEAELVQLRQAQEAQAAELAQLQEIIGGQRKGFLARLFG